MGDSVGADQPGGLHLERVSTRGHGRGSGRGESCKHVVETSRSKRFWQLEAVVFKSSPGSLFWRSASVMPGIAGATVCLRG